MPLYEYECYVCERRFERIQKVSDDPVRECPSCGGQVRRLLGVPALQFKGSGWYVTDYGKGNGRSKTDTGTTGEPSSGNGTADKSTDSKPAPAKAENKKAEARA